MIADGDGGQGRVMYTRGAPVEKEKDELRREKDGVRNGGSETEEDKIEARGADEG